jgi:hypothetical protein
VLHLTWTYGLVLRKLTGHSTRLVATDDWPLVPLPPSEENWVAAINGLREANAQVRRAVNGFPEDRLDDPPVEDPRYSAYTQFIGLTQHAPIMRARSFSSSERLRPNIGGQHTTRETISEY